MKTEGDPPWLTRARRTLCRRGSAPASVLALACECLPRKFALQAAILSRAVGLALGRWCHTFRAFESACAPSFGPTFFGKGAVVREQRHLNRPPSWVRGWRRDVPSVSYQGIVGHAQTSNGRQDLPHAVVHLCKTDGMCCLKAETCCLEATFGVVPEDAALRHITKARRAEQWGMDMDEGLTAPSLW